MSPVPPERMLCVRETRDIDPILQFDKYHAFPDLSLALKETELTTSSIHLERWRWKMFVGVTATGVSGRGTWCVGVITMACFQS